MGYHLGIDLGTTYTGAGIHRDGQVAIASLGDRAPTIPSVVFLREDGTVLTGDSANRRAPSEPSRGAREFKRRIGDPTPVLVGGVPYPPRCSWRVCWRGSWRRSARRKGARPTSSR